MTTRKTIALTRWTVVSKGMSLLFNMLSRLTRAFLQRGKSLNFMVESPSAVILESKKIKSFIVSTISPSIYLKVMGQDAMIFIFWMLSFQPTFSLCFHQEALHSSSVSAIRVASSLYLRLCFSRQFWFQLVLHPAQNFTWYTLHRS